MYDATSSCGFSVLAVLAVLLDEGVLDEGVPSLTP